MMEDRVVLYDGECGMCNYVVQWLMRADRREQMRFAAQQGPWAGTHFPDAGSWNAVGYVRNGQLYIGFPAVRRMLLDLGWGWQLAGSLLYLVPSPIGHWGYGIIADHRKRFFREPACLLLSMEQRKRFLDTLL